MPSPDVRNDKLRPVEKPHRTGETCAARGSRERATGRAGPALSSSQDHTGHAAGGSTPSPGAGRGCCTDKAPLAGPVPGRARCGVGVHPGPSRSEAQPSVMGRTRFSGGLQGHCHVPSVVLRDRDEDILAHVYYKRKAMPERSEELS